MRQLKKGFIYSQRLHMMQKTLHTMFEYKFMCFSVVYMVYLYTMCTYLFPTITVDLDIEHKY